MIRSLPVACLIDLTVAIDGVPATVTIEWDGRRVEPTELDGEDAWWFLQDRLVAAKVDYSKARLPLRPYIVVDRNLYTGQNPQSSERLATKLVEDLG